MVLQQVQADLPALLTLTEEAVTLETHPQLGQVNTLSHQAGLGQEAGDEAAVWRLGGGTEAGQESHWQADSEHGSPLTVSLWSDISNTELL